MAPSLGPILGGVLAGREGWPWIFWFLTIISGSCLIALLVFLPETCRSIVGDGSIPALGINKAFSSMLPCWQPCPPDSREGLSRIRSLHFPNPLKCLLILFQKDTALIVLVNGIFYMAYCCIQASLSSLFIELYGFEELDTGLIYLPFGIGCVISSYSTGNSFFSKIRRSR